LIADLEEEQKQIREAMSDSELFAKDPARATTLYERDAQIDVDLMAALERWEILSAS
jgi:ATP-binding cassette subfamily F protein uup